MGADRVARRARLEVQMSRQPDEVTCGPTCLHAVYRYFGRHFSLPRIIREVRQFRGGGTLAALLGLHALQHGFSADLYTYNLVAFDPTWFSGRKLDLRQKLKAQLRFKGGRKLRRATAAYLEFLERGGRIHFEDLTVRLVRRFLSQGQPILTGLSATWLYGCMREYGARARADDVRGESAGHFVVLCGYHSRRRTVTIADPQLPNPVAEHSPYEVRIERLLCAILLGILSFDGNLLIIRPR